MLPGCGEGTQSRSVCGISSSLGVELLPKPAYIFRFVVDDRKHSTQEKQVAGL
jgi:hypothetical protein